MQFSEWVQLRQLRHPYNVSICQYQVQSCRKRSVLTAGSSTALLIVATKKTTIPLLGTRLFELGHRKSMAFPAGSLELSIPPSLYAIKYPNADQAR